MQQETMSVSRHERVHASHELKGLSMGTLSVATSVKPSRKNWSTAVAAVSSRLTVVVVHDAKLQSTYITSNLRSSSLDVNRQLRCATL